MNSATITYIIIGILLCGAYIIAISLIIYGWIKTEEKENKVSTEKIFTSIIIPFRNEESNIEMCIRSLISQNYPSSQYEIILIDDSSTDKTTTIAESWASKHSNISIITLKEYNAEGKKKAIEAAIQKAKGELIITTDADCCMGKEWLAGIVNYYISSNAKMIVAPVMFQNEKSIFEKMQSLEFVALMASTAGSIYFNKPTMCNGANLAYSKKTFDDVNGFRSIEDGVSGDDVLLMYKIDKMYPGSVKYLKDRDSIVYTNAQPTLMSFINQRIRWASKGLGQMNKASKALSFTIFFFNVWICFNPFILLGYMAFPAYFSSVTVEICLIIFGIKCIIDFLLLFLASRFFRKRGLLIYFLPQQLLYPFYVTGIGFLGRRKKYIWKDRTING